MDAQTYRAAVDRAERIESEITRPERDWWRIERTLPRSLRSLDGSAGNSRFIVAARRRAPLSHALRRAVTRPPGTGFSPSVMSRTRSRLGG